MWLGRGLKGWRLGGRYGHRDYEISYEAQRWEAQYTYIHITDETTWPVAHMEARSGIIWSLQDESL